MGRGESVLWVLVSLCKQDKTLIQIRLRYIARHSKLFFFFFLTSCDELFELFIL